MLQEQLIQCCCQEQPPSPPTPKPARVIQIDPADGAQFTLPPDALPTHIVITFNKHLQAATVNTATIQVTWSDPQNLPAPVAGTVSYDDATMSATFTPSTMVDGVPQFGGDALGIDYHVTVRGSGSDPIRDGDNLALDGAGTGSPGSDFTSSFTVTI